MAGNIFGNILKVSTFGESHGPAIGCVIDGVPPLLELSEEDIQKDLDRRKPGQSTVTTSRQEGDIVEILSGVFEGKTTGTPIALLIRNKDQQSKDYTNIKDIFRPGHADFSFDQKFGIRDYRGGGRSSGRETAARVAAGAVAKKVLLAKGIIVSSFVCQISDIHIEDIDLSIIENNIVRSPDQKAAEKMIEAIEKAKQEENSLGGAIKTIIKGCPTGLGDPVFDKLEAKLAHAVMSIGGVKGVEFGSGFAAASMKGSDHNDALQILEGGKPKTKNNFSGGISGGISNGEDIVFRLAVKPTSSIAQKQQALSKEGATSEIEIRGRHDPCLCPRIVPVVEAMAALVLADCLLIQETIR